MMLNSKTTRQWIGVSFLSVFVFAIFGSLFLARRAYAQDPNAAAEAAGAQAEAVCHAAPFSPPCVGTSIKNTAQILGDRIVKPTFKIALVQGLLNISQFVVNRLAYEAALLVANGGPGQGSLFYHTSVGEGFSKFGLEVAGEAVAELSDTLNTGLGTQFDLCLPPGPLFRLGLQIGIQQKYQPKPPRCDILEVAASWDNFVSDTYESFSDSDKRQKAVLSKFAESLQPGRNELSASIKLNIELTKKVDEEKQKAILDQQPSEAVKDVKDPVTKKTKTPSKVVEQDFLDKIKKAVTGETTQLKASEIGTFGDAMGGLALTAASTFTNTLLSQLFNKIYKGLFDTKPDNKNVFNVEAVANSAQNPEAFSKIFATMPVATADYNALTEFVVCPPQGIANRGLNNCVMDSNFLAAISRGNSGAPLTVQEAIDEGLIKGNWPLISPEKQEVNQDQLCYTYAFCYANLVKLRKARVVPIGWELAALRNSVSKPKTLQDIIKEFNNCNQYGTIDGEHPFCHLIDPNWVLKYPDTQCRATVNGEIKLTQLSPGRQSVCADAPSCLGEDSRGECAGGYGYCIKEKNVWRFRGDECPVQYAGCLAMKSTTSGDQKAFLINTVDFSVCGQNNAGCQWYRTNKELNVKQANNPADDTYDWLLPNEEYQTSGVNDRDNDWKYQLSNDTVSQGVIYGSAPKRFSYEDRAYFTRLAQSCSANDAGCSELISAKDATLNMLRNPSFEDDENKDGIPDGWFLQSIQLDQNGKPIGLTIEVNKSAARGTKSVEIVGQNGKGLVQFFPMSSNQAYTLSYFVVSDAPPKSPTTRMSFFDENGAALSLISLSISSGCSVTANTLLDTAPEATSDWKRVSCSFVVPKNTKTGKLLVEAEVSVRYDGIQLEPNELVTDFTTGFSAAGEQLQHTKMAPDYLSCTGTATDPAACSSYAQMCQAQDVGCNLYSPSDGDPSVPAITSPLDICPSECVGYATFKQAATRYDDEDFPLHFIPEKATACSAQYVGCDSFTNLSFAAEGGEGVENYTNLRACATPEMADGSSAKKQSATFFTWEGSDNAGYQLRSWVLLKSNMTNAPCTKWQVEDKSTLVCAENANHQLAIAANTECDAHQDIFSNPDCREFFDASGNVHYREFSDTVTVNEACAPYRKDVSTKDDCQTSGGFWDSQVGFCRYFGLASESAVCPATASGCRSYTGGAGRNLATLLSETFESGAYSALRSWPNVNAASLTISNESVATNGHSLRVFAGNNQQAGFATVHAYLNNQNANITYDPTSDATQTATCSAFDNNEAGHKITPAGCEIDLGKNGTVDCIVGSKEHSCGTLVNKIVSGKTFMVEFWAKGSGKLYAGFEENGGAGVEHDLVEVSNPLVTYSQFKSLQLSGSWQVYSLGPFDASKFNGINKDSILFFFTDSDQTFFIDNLLVKQLEENITLMKDSWVVPSTCDSAPNGVNSPQYYLGCEAYSDQNGDDHTLYQFSKLCSEKVVGCERLYRTFESESVYEQAFNVRCVKATNNNLAVPSVVNVPTACTVNGKEYCTIATGRSFCTLDFDGTFGEKPPLDKNTGFGIVYGPETVIVPADKPVYIVNNGSANCDAGSAGCKEVGKPKFSQDQKKVESFESAYFINDPDQYKKILCDDDALFCEEYTSTKDGNFYFKSPVNKTCEYKSNVEIDGKKYEGWFRSGTSDFCYPNYMIAGDKAAIWKNGDDNYDGWVGQCPQDQDLCTEFIDIVDTEGGLKKDGTSYHFLNNDKLTETQSASSGACKGQVSQKAGCALFNNRSRSELTYNASVSYIVSTHADVLLNKAANSLVDPVSCAGTKTGIYQVSDANKELFALEDLDPQQAGTQVALCNMRCEYITKSDDPILSNMSQKYNDLQNNQVSYLERACLIDSDCPSLQTKNSKIVKGSCTKDYVDDEYRLSNDSNTVLKVNRDRSCSAWLACKGARVSWNERTNKHEPICDSVDLCVKGKALGQTAVCEAWDPRAPEILTDYQYSKRDVNWNGYELSGYAIPNQLPVELYDQYNLNQEKACQKNGSLVSKAGTLLPVGAQPVFCEKQTDCGNGGGNCEPVSPDYRLVYNAGPCNSAQIAAGGTCQVGRCSLTKNACSQNSDCPGGGNKCMTGVCQTVATKDCVNADCSCSSNGACANAKTAANQPANVCDPISKVCVDKLTTGQGIVECGPGNACPAQGATCIASATTAIGSCYNNRCLTDIKDKDSNGFADQIKLTNALSQSCRGYPEVDSPYPAKVVETWMTGKTKQEGGAEKPDKGFDTSESPSKPWSRPYTYKTGYQDSKVCGVKVNGTIADCDCSYEKVEYGKGSALRFEEPNAGVTVQGYCTGGPFEGHVCDSDETCSTDKEKGTCLKLNKQDTMIGWKGYCIEKDTSIQLYASTDAKDRACLTWLPVDQLSGATDLYAKYTTAGFSPQDTYYCAQIGLTYDIGTTPYYCAETQDGSCDDAEDQNLADAVNDDDPDDDVNCPVGFFAIMGPCGDYEPSGVSCTESDGDDDYPYFCVPKLSYKTQNDKDEPTLNGEPCTIPKDGDYHSTDTRPNGVVVYEMSASKYEEYWPKYNDCKVRGVFDPAQQIPDNINLYGRYSPTNSSLTAYPACASLVQVASKKDKEGLFNVAWTNRVWKQSGYHLTNSVQEKGFSSAYECAETKGATYCSNPFDDNPWGSVNCPANYFAILGPCNDSVIGSNCSDWIEDDDYPYYCVAKGLKRVLPDGKEEECNIPKAGDYITKSGGPSGKNGAIDVYYMGAEKWLEYQTFYGKCGLGTFGYSAETKPVVFGEAIDIANKLNKDQIKDPYPHRFAMCQSGSNQILQLEGSVCPFGTTKVTTMSEEEARPYYGVEVVGAGGAFKWCDSDEKCNGGKSSCNNLKCVGGATHNNKACDAALGQNASYADKAKCKDPNQLPSCLAELAKNVCKDDGGSCVGACEGGNWAGGVCSNKNDCEKQYCQELLPGTGYCLNNNGSNYSIKNSANEGPDIGSKRMQQLFAKSFDFLRFQSDDIYPLSLSTTIGKASDFTSLEQKVSNTYSKIPNVPALWNWDIRKSGDVKKPTAPKVVSLGSCSGTKCREGKEDTFTVNDRDDGIVEGKNSSHVTVSFFAYADSEQMPIRKIVVDWGDGDDFGTLPWPTDSQSGSIANDNFYKNHRGVNAPGEDVCGAGADEFGKSPDACTSSFVAFTHDYVCSVAYRTELEAAGRLCKTAQDGRLLNSPCIGGDVPNAGGKCVYQPRVHVKDNWGWCTGFCNAGDDGTNGCFEGSGNNNNECNISMCPSEHKSNKCPDANPSNPTSNPWINFDGYVIIEPEN